jgi:DNA-binding protein HU-beta
MIRDVLSSRDVRDEYKILLTKDREKKCMNRTELIDFVAEKVGLTKAVSSNALDALFAAITGSLQKGDPVVLVNFGTFTVKQRAAREGRNPSTGEKIKIKAAKVVGFKAGKALKEAVKEEAKEEA